MSRMKPEWTGEDAVIDRLLRAQIGRPGAAVVVCPGFDPDLANAYVEQVLSAGERGRYEVHLAECPDCRTRFLTLAQLADVPAYGPNPDLAPADFAGREARTGWREAVAGFWESLARPGWARPDWARPQWAAVAGLALFALVVVPLLVLRMNASRHDTVDLARNQQVSPPMPPNGSESQEKTVSPASQPAGLAQPVTREAGGEKTGSTGEGAASNAASDEERKKADSNRADKPEQPSSSAGVAGTVAAAASPVLARDDRDAAEKDAKSEAAAKETGVEPAPPVAERRREAPASSNEPSLPKISGSDALRLPDEKGTGQVNVVRGVSVREDVHPKEKSGAIKSQDAPPADTSTDASGARRVAAQPSGRALVAGRTSEEAARGGPAPATTAGKPEKGERRIEGKRFRLINGVWTDKSYNPTGAMAAVTVINSSDVYNQLVEKEAGLKAYLSHFGPDERAIIVYKKIAYKLLPKETKN